MMRSGSLIIQELYCEACRALVAYFAPQTHITIRPHERVGRHTLCAECMRAKKRA